jgi:hypothetical protein
MAIELAAATKKAATNPRKRLPQKQSGHPTDNGGKAKTAQARPSARKGSQNDGLKRSDMITAVLKRRPGLSVRDLMNALDKEFGWKCTENNLTGHLYTNPKFARTKADRSANRPITWSLK